MARDTYLKSAEEVKYRGSGTISYASRPYQLVLTNKRIVLLGPLDSKRDDIVSVKLKSLLDIKYEESGSTEERGGIHIMTGGSREVLYGPTALIKAVYKQVKRLV